MKLFKKIVMITFFFSISCMFIQSILPVGMDENKMKASKIEGITWNFEFKNKEKKAFQLSLKNGKTIILDRYAIQPSKGSAEKDHFYLRLSDLDLHKPVYIAIFYPDKKGTDHGFLIQGKGKTEFLTYENGSLRPQSGTGVFNKETQSGLNLKNNISDKDIAKLSYEKAMSYFNAPVKTPEKPKKVAQEQKIEAWKKMSIEQLKKEEAKIAEQIVDTKIDVAIREALIPDLEIIGDIIKTKKRATWEKMSVEQLRQEEKKTNLLLDSLKGAFRPGQKAELTKDLETIKSIIEKKK